MATVVFLAVWLGSIILSYRIGRSIGRPTMGLVLALLFGPIGLGLTWLVAHDHGIPVQQVRQDR